MTGREYAGSMAGRRQSQALLAEAGLVVATAGVPHAIDGLLGIDHIATPASWTITSCRRVVAAHDGARLSDHDAYVVEASPP